MAMESNCLFDILDPQVGKEGKKEDVVMDASLARSCLRLNGKERPTMKEVTMVLERIQKFDNLIIQQEIEYDRNEVMGTPWDATSPRQFPASGSVFPHHLMKNHSSIHTEILYYNHDFIK
ncbi:hypothetical protein OIU76_030308 [Salix suchowensis]|nr:hypothetical protein OIU76_030308 [Salix suchowensis]